MKTFSAGDYTANVLDDHRVDVFYKGTLIDNPGPWGDAEGAERWAEAIVQKYSVDGHNP